MFGHNDGPPIGLYNRFQPFNSSIDNFPMLSQNNKKKRQRVEECSKVNAVSVNFGRILLITHQDPNLNLNSLSPFFIQKGLDAHSKNLKNITRFRNGTLLVETSSQVQTNIMLEAKSFGSPGFEVPINVKDHPFFNFCKGTIYSYDLLNCSEQEIKEELKNQKVVEVYRVKKVNDAKSLINTPALILTFDAKIIPRTVKAGFLNLNVKPYYPRPMQCKICQKYGHTKKKCTRTSVCPICSQEPHEDKCVNDPHCLNC